MNEETQYKPETEEEARARFWANYVKLAGDGADVAWFDKHVEPLIALAISAPKAHIKAVDTA